MNRARPRTHPRTCLRIGVLVVQVALQSCRTSPLRSAADSGKPEAVAQQLLAGARRALGTTERVQSLTAVASVVGPRGSFVTTVHSARDGRARLAIGQHFLAGIGAHRGWMVDEAADSVAPLEAATRSMVRGHELHMLVLAPETRWREPRVGPNERWDGEAALAVAVLDDLGEPATLFFRVADTLPLGLRLVNHTGEGAREVGVSFAGWNVVDGTRLFRQAVFTHGDDRYAYSYTDIRLNAVPDSVFEPPAQVTRPAQE